MRIKRMPSDSVTGLLFSRMCCTSSAGIYNNAVVLAGMVTFQVNRSMSFFQALLITPCTDWYDAFTNCNPSNGVGRMMIFLKPVAESSDLIPATFSYIHTSRSPSSITWFCEFILGLAVLPFHNSQMVVAPCFTIYPQEGYVVSEIRV